MEHCTYSSKVAFVCGKKCIKKCISLFVKFVLGPMEWRPVVRLFDVQLAQS